MQTVTVVGSVGCFYGMSNRSLSQYCTVIFRSMYSAPNETNNGLMYLLGCECIMYLFK